MIRFLILLATLLLSSGCASYASRVTTPRRAFESGDYPRAAATLSELAAKQDNDELLYLMDLGIVYHTAGNYAEAIKTFLKADKLAEISDYTSITAEGASVLLNDQVKAYKGEGFEKILVNVYLAIDYTLNGQYDEALVECRRVNHKLDMMISKGGFALEQNSFAKYLAAALFEARGEYNDSFVDYRTLLKWGNEGFPYLPGPLLRVADKLKASEELAEYRSQFPQVGKYRMDKNDGQVILILEQGKVPIKVPSPAFRLLPVFRKRYYTSDHAVMREKSGFTLRTYPLFDIEATAIRELDSRIAGIAAKKVAGVVAKEAAAYAVQKATKSELAGALTSLFLHASDSADLRSWSTLPARLQISRTIVPAGLHDIVLDMVSASGFETKEVKRWTSVAVKPGETVFLNYRSRD